MFTLEILHNLHPGTLNVLKECVVAYFSVESLTAEKANANQEGKSSMKIEIHSSGWQTLFEFIGKANHNICTKNSFSEGDA